MLISVIIPCFNAEKWICETLESVYSQRGNFSLEVIVVNDGSTDNSEKVVKTNFPYATIITTKNMGASEARNTGFNISKGDFIQFLDADDLLAHNKLKIQLNLLYESDLDIAYGNWQYLDEDKNGEFNKAKIVQKIMNNPEIDLFTEYWFPPAVYLFRREIVERVGGWHKNLPIIQDARFALDSALKGAKFIYVNQIVAYYRNSFDNSLSKDENKFILDCFNNACEVEKIWLSKGDLSDEKKLALSINYEFVSRVSYKKNKELFEKAYPKLKYYGITDDLIKKNTSRNFYLLNKILGYKIALHFNKVFHNIKSMNYKSLFNRFDV